MSLARFALSCNHEFAGPHGRPRSALMPAGFRDVPTCFSHDNEWLPASSCSIDSFDGSVEAVAGGGGPGPDAGGFDAAGNSAGAAGNGSNPFASPGAGLTLTGADAASLGAFGAALAAGYFGPTGLVGAAVIGGGYISSSYASDPLTAAGHLGQDAATALGNTWDFAGPQ